MEDFIKSRLGQAILWGVVVSITAIILWPLFDMFYCNVITHSEFNWNVNNHLIRPILVGVFFGIFEYIWQISAKRIARKSTKKGKK